MLLTRNAVSLFPRKNGVIVVNGKPYFYDDRIDSENLNYAKLTNIRSDPKITNPFPLVVTAASTYVILSPAIHIITAEGKSGEVTYTEKWYNQYGGSVYDRQDALRLSPKSRKPHIAFGEEDDLNRVVGGPNAPSSPSYITANNLDKSIVISGSSGLGAAWFSDTRPIGGNRDYCQNGECLFERGIRVFFTLEYSGSGDWLIFSLINGASNSNSSIGGEKDFAELLGYSGDGRLDAGGTLFIPGSTRNLNPPKMGLEFDTKINYSSTQEEFLKYCTGSNLNACTRTDPEVAPGSDTCLDPASGLKDAVQYVFWGNSSLNIPCRNGDPSYDDNRHNAVGDSTQNWSFSAGANIESSPALLPDGTIIFGAWNGRLYGVSPDGSSLGYFQTFGRVYSPTVASDGTVYVGSQDGNLYALNSNGSLRWSFGTGGAVRTKPAVPGNGKVYFGSDDGRLYALFTSNGAVAWSFNTGAPVQSSPSLSANESRVYFGSDNGTFYALNADTGVEIWSPNPTPFPTNAFKSSPAVGPDGTIYVGSDNGHLYAFNSATGAVKWSKYTGEGVRSSPAVGVLSDGTVIVYFGSYNDYLYALYADSGDEKWKFKAGSDIQSPIAVDGNNHIYFGSNDNKVYALYPDGSEKWSFPTGGDIRGKPLVKADGTVYAGSFDFKLYAINQFANPKNYRDRLITYNSGSVGGVPVNVEGSGDDWLKGVSGKRLWAVRMEIWRDICDPFSLQPCTPPLPGTYTLKTWLRQCGNIDGKNDCSDVIGTFYEDTRVFYSPTTPTARPAQLEQTINLLPRDHQDFERFLFGFTSQTASGDLQTATIRDFQLSFIRPNDPTITEDTAWP